MNGYIQNVPRLGLRVKSSVLVERGRQRWFVGLVATSTRGGRAWPVGFSLFCDLWVCCVRPRRGSVYSVIPLSIGSLVTLARKSALRARTWKFIEWWVTDLSYRTRGWFLAQLGAFHWKCNLQRGSRSFHVERYLAHLSRILLDPLISNWAALSAIQR